MRPAAERSQVRYAELEVATEAWMEESAKLEDAERELGKDA